VNDGGHRDAAIAALGAREYERAGNEYTRAGWRCLAEPRDGLGPFEDDEKGWVGRGLGWLAKATAAYRVGGRDRRATRRAVSGVALARDLRSTVEDSVRSACLGEFVADFKALGGLDGVDGAYADAEAAYRSAPSDDTDPRGPATTPLFEAAADVLQQVARGPANGEIAVTWEDLHGADPSDPGAFLAHRARYKRQRFPSLLEQVVESGYLAAPRGTTEYDNANHRCPDCGSADTNWVGDSVLCLRCSTPMAAD